MYDEMILRNIELYYRHIYENAEKITIRGIDVVIRTFDNRLYIYEITNGNMHLVVRDIEDITDDEIHKDFIRQVKYRMLLKTVMQSDLARYCGVAQTTISRYLSGNSIPDVIMANKMAEVLGCKLNDLILDKEMIFNDEQ